MLPIFLIRSTIDWIRHADKFKDSNPYSRAEEALKTHSPLMARRIWTHRKPKLLNRQF